MGLFDRFPYTNFHELNLDWIIEKIKTIEETGSQTEEYAAEARAKAEEAAASATAAQESADSVAGLADQIRSNTARLDASGIIFIGDSYGLDSAIEDGGRAWATILYQDVYPDATYLIEGGTGFSSDTYMAHNWLSMLTAYVENLTEGEREAITQVIVVGGANDGNLLQMGTVTPSLILSRIQAFCAYVAANLPYAKIKCAFVGWHLLYQRHAFYLIVRDIYAQVMADNYSYYSNGEPILMGNDTIGEVNGVHPLTDSSIVLAEFVASLASGGDFRASRSVEVTVDTTAATVDNVTDILYMRARYDGHMCQITLLGSYEFDTWFRLTIPTGTTLMTQSYVLADLKGTPVGNKVPALTPVICHGYGEGSVYKGTISALLAIQENKLWIKFNSPISQVIRAVLVPFATFNMEYRNS